MSDEKKVGATVDPKEAVQHGWWGTSPVHKDREDYTVAVQGPIAEKAAQGGARAEGVGTVDESAAGRQAVKSPKGATK